MRLFYQKSIYLSIYLSRRGDARRAFLRARGLHRMRAGGLLVLLSLKLALGMVATASPPRSVLVTGATEGLGLAAAHQLVEAGHTVLVHGRNAPKVERVVASLEASGGKAVGLVCDLSSMAEVRRLGAEVSAAWPALDGLLNNAGSFDGDYTGQRVVTEVRTLSQP